MNNYFSQLGVTDPSNLSISDQIQYQQLQMQKKKKDAEEESGITNIVGGEFIKVGLEQMGKGIAAKTGFSSLANLGKNISSKGFTKGLSQTIADARKEALAKGTKFGQEDIDSLTSRAKGMLSRSAQGKMADVEKWTAGRKNAISNINKELTNRGLPNIDPNDVTTPSSELLQKVQDIKDKGVSAVVDPQVPKTQIGKAPVPPDPVQSAPAQPAQPAQPDPTQPKSQLPSTQQEADYLEPPPATPANASDAKIRSDQSDLVDIDNSLDSRLSQLSSSDQRTITDSYGSDFERNVGALPIGQARNAVIANNINIKKQALKENAPELLDDTQWEGSSNSNYMAASRAKNNIMQSATQKLSPAQQAQFRDEVTSHPNFTNSKDLKALGTQDDVGQDYRAARNANNDIREEIYNKINPVPTPAVPVPATGDVQFGGASSASSAGPAPTASAGSSNAGAAVNTSTTQQDTGSSGSTVPTGGVDDDDDDSSAASSSARNVERDVDTGIQDAQIGGDAVEAVGGSILGGALPVVLGLASLILPSLFESDKSSAPIVAPPSISQTSTMGQGR